MFGFYLINNKFLFISLLSFFVIFLWFYCINYVWYWIFIWLDFYDEVELLRRCNWFEIGVGKSKSVIGGYWYG